MRRREVAITYGCNPSENIDLWDRKDPSSVPSGGELVVIFFNYQTTIHEESGTLDCTFMWVYPGSSSHMTSQILLILIDFDRVFHHFLI